MIYKYSPQVKQYLLLLSLAMITPVMLLAQSNTLDYSPDPVWIKMIDDPKTNYYEAQKIYESYWKSHVKPEAENDIIGQPATRSEKKERKERDREMSKMTTAQREGYMRMKYQCKRFENWMNEVKPFVQEDGHILTQEEQSAIWNKQQEEMKRGGK